MDYWWILYFVRFCTYKLDYLRFYPTNMDQKVRKFLLNYLNSISLAISGQHLQVSQLLHPGSNVLIISPICHWEKYFPRGTESPVCANNATSVFIGLDATPWMIPTGIILRGHHVEAERWTYVDVGKGSTASNSASTIIVCQELQIKTTMTNHYISTQNVKFNDIFDMW